MVRARRGSLWLGGLLLLMGLIWGCGPSEESTPSSTAGGSEPTTQVVVTAEPAVSRPSSTLPVGEYGGHIVALARADAKQLDVHEDVSPTLAARGPGVSYSRMLRLRTGEEIAQPRLLLECDLCESWRLEDELVYEFRLREGVRWQDVAPVNGRELSAQDVVFSYNRQRTSGWANSPLLQGVESVEAPDERTVRVKLRYWDTDFLLALADGRSKVVAPDVVIASGSLEPGPVVGTGPWTWLRTVDGDGSEFEANPDYFEEGLPFADQLTFKVIKDPEARFAAFVTGQLDVYDAEAGEWELLDSMGFTGKTVISKEGGLSLMLAMNAGAPPFDDGDVRRAVFGAMQPLEYMEGPLAGEETFGAGMPVVKGGWLLDRETVRGYFGGGTGVDVVGKAVELLVGDFGDEQVALGGRIESALREAGFVTSMTVLNPVDYSERVWRKRDYQMFLGPPPPASGPNGYLFSALHSGGQRNILGHGDGELDGLIEAQQESGFDSKERGEAIREIQRRLLGEAYLVSLGGGSTLWVTQEWVEGFYPNTALAEYIFWAKTWLGGGGR